MTLSIWRYAHMALAVLSSAFLLVLSVTGVILAVDSATEKTQPYKVENFEQITLVEVIPTLRDQYFEILEVSVDHNDFVKIDALDENGESIQAYIDPRTGNTIGKVQPKSDFINWVTALHRSLFLKETGRLMVAIVSFLLTLIALSGLMLVAKRQHGVKNFFTKVKKDFFSQFFHVILGRWLLLPILIIAISGLLVFLARVDIFKGKEVVQKVSTSQNQEPKSLHDFSFFKETKLRSVERIEFPFIPDDEAEPFIIHLRKKTVTLNQVTGQIISTSQHPISSVVEKFNLDLHTGRTNGIWALFLGVSSLFILFFIYSGFVIMYKRTRSRIRNKYTAQDAEIVLLVGSENGSTLHFANKIQQQLYSEGKKAYVSEMNLWQDFPKCQHIIVLTSTYGLGDAPSNATKFEKLVNEIPQHLLVNYSVVGFGSRAYHDFCSFAYRVDALLAKQSWTHQLLPVFTVNDRSIEDFAQWILAYNVKAGTKLSSSSAIYQTKIMGLSTFKVIEKSIISEDNATFKIVLQPTKKLTFQSGDLLAIYPANDQRERFYSIAKMGNSIQLMVKLYNHGLGTQFLYGLQIGESCKAKLVANTGFHVPKYVNKVALIANGTGIAPFLGIIDENTQQKDIRLYAGFRYHNSLVREYDAFCETQKTLGKLTHFRFAFSREENRQYVMDLIKVDGPYFAQLLKENGVIMICGALQMQQDVEAVLEEIVQNYHGTSLEIYKTNNQILTDCY